MINDFYKVLRDSRDKSKTVYKRNYALSYRDNIFGREIPDCYFKMFKKGGGKELSPKDGQKEKAACLYSSSMLAYNFFHWVNQTTPLTYDGEMYNKVVFEEQFRVLKSRNNRANLDVVLVSHDNKTLLLLESKFTEHLKKGDVDIRPSYFDTANYYKNDGSRWAEIMRDLQEQMKEKDAYYDGLKQIACHLIGISSAEKDRRAREWFNNNSWLHNLYNINLESIERFIFKSIVFHPLTKEEDVLSEQYEQRVKDFVKKISFLPQSIVIHKNPIITYKEIWEEGMKASINDDRLIEYLEQYLKAHK